MKLSELIEKHGDDAVAVQPLDSCVSSMNYSHKKGTTATFGTQETLGPNGFHKMGLIVWLDREKVAQIIEDEKREKQAAQGE